MAIQEPNDPAGLWEAVKPRTEWPATDEMQMLKLSEAWNGVWATFWMVGGEQPDSRLADGWGDGNGRKFRSKVYKLRGLVSEDAVRMQRLAWLAKSYGEDVAHTKSEIRRVIYENAHVYSNASSLFGRLMGVTGGPEMVEEIANEINDFLARMAERIAARGRGDVVPPLTELEVGPYELGGREHPIPAEAAGVGNWNPLSRPTFGHTFSTHGAGAANTRSLADRARSTGRPQGQWLNDDAAAQFLREQYIPGAGTRAVRIPEGLGQVIMPDGTLAPAKWAILVPGRNGFYKSAYPTVGP